MLGAKARAAEYNAAKAASARQAFRESEEQKDPPVPAAQPLSAFVRHASGGRNKGNKTWKPLVISEDSEDLEDPRIMSTFDQVGGSTNSSPGVQDLVERRPASLPPRPMMLGPRPELLHTVSSPYAGLYGVTPTAPRAMQPTDLAHLYSCMAQERMLDQQFPLMQNIPNPRYVRRSTIPTPQLSWMAPPESNEMPHQMPTASLLSYKTPSGLLADGNHNRSPGSDIKAGLPKLDTAFPKVTRESDRIPGQTDEYVFGPDDLSPTKMENKTARRMQNFEADKRKQKHLQALTAEDHVSSHSSLEVLMGDSPLQQRKQLAVAQRNVLRVKQEHKEQAVPVIQENRDRMLTEIAVEDFDNTPERLPKYENHPLHGSGKPRHLTEIALSVPETPRGQHTLTSTFNGPEEVAKRFLELSQEGLNRQVLLSDTAQQSSHRVAHQISRVPTPPGLEHMSGLGNGRAGPTANMGRKEEKQLTDIQFPLVDMQSKEWLEIRLPTAEEREKLQRVMRAVAGSKSSPEYNGVDPVVFTTSEWKQWAKQRRQLKETRKGNIDHLVDEMQQKWQRTHKNGESAMTGPEAKKAAVAAKAVGSMMANLQQNVEDMKVGVGAGSRPYSAAPEHAIDHSIHLSRKGVTTVFETEAVDGQSAPRRIARDPRFCNVIGKRGGDDRAN